MSSPDLMIQPCANREKEKTDSESSDKKYCGARFVATVFSLSFCKRLDQTSLAGSEHVEHHLDPPFLNFG